MRHACEACGAPVDGDDRVLQCLWNTARLHASRGEARRRTAPSRRRASSAARTAGPKCRSIRINAATFARFAIRPTSSSCQPIARPGQRPEFVIGFAVTPEQAAEKVSTSGSRPRRLVPAGRSGDTAKVEERLQGVYLPFWSFSMLPQSRGSARDRRVLVSHRDLHDDRERQDGHQDAAGARDRVVAACPAGIIATTAATWSRGSHGLPQQYADAIQPFQIAALKRYEPYFPGRLADRGVFDRARRRPCSAAARSSSAGNSEHVRQFLPGDTPSGLVMRRRVQRDQLRPDPVAGLFAELPLPGQGVSLSAQRPDRPTWTATSRSRGSGSRWRCGS